MELDTGPQIAPVLTRRRFVKVGATGAATIYLGGLGFDRLKGTAQAASAATGAGPELRRSSYLALTSSKFSATADGASRTLELVGVEDLQSALSVPELRGSEKAFSLRFLAPGAEPLKGETRTLSHPDLGSFPLFVSPVGQADPGEQEYEAVIDRTVTLPGLQGDIPGPAEGRATEPREGGGGSTAAPRLVDGALRRSRSRLKLVGHATFAPGADVVSANARILRGGRLVARARPRLADGVALLSFHLNAPAPAGHYDLELTALDSAGGKTILTRSLRVR